VPQLALSLHGLPFYSGTEYMKAITVYYASGIRGLEAHFSSSTTLSGMRRGHSLHFPLHSDEKVSSVWLRYMSFGERSCGTCLMVSLILSRTTLNSETISH
jgi:hypothetical protein